MRLVGAVQLVFAICCATAADSTATEIPFTFRDGFIRIDVTVAGHERPLKFLLDSGAQVSVVHEAIAKRLGFKGGRRVVVEAVGGRTTGLWPLRMKAQAGAVPLNRDFLVLDLQKLKNSSIDGEIDGIIGLDFFHERVVQIDFEHQKVRLLRRPPGDSAEILPLKVRRCGMLVPIQVNGSGSQWVRLDTGCASALHWVTSSINTEHCTRRVAVALTPVPIVVTNTQVGIGDSNFSQVPTDLHKKEIFPGEKGLLGNGLLARFKSITIDQIGGQLILR